MTETTAAGPQPRTQITIAYVAGIGRTGTTVLGELLDRLPGVAFVGELSRFWRRYVGRQPCSCGSPLPECPFWSEVLARAFGALSMSRAEALARLEARVLRQQAPQLLASKGWGSAAHKMVEERSRFYQAVSEVAGANWIVDTGKEPVFGASLSRLEGAAVVVVHLVRDPRGVAFSSGKRITSDSEGTEMTRLSAANAARQWLASNLVVQVALARLADRYSRVRYEDLVSDPEACLLALAKATGLPVPDAREAVECLSHPPRHHHLVAGNPGVRRLGGVLRLSLDEEWRRSMSTRDQRTVTAICAVLMATYGYPLRARPRAA